MWLRYYYNGLSPEAQRTFRERRGRLFLAAGLGLNTVAYCIGRFSPASQSDLGCFLTGACCALAIVLLGASMVLARPWGAR
jgi:hypothetical protein